MTIRDALPNVQEARPSVHPQSVLSAEQMEIAQAFVAAARAWIEAGLPNIFDVKQTRRSYTREPVDPQVTKWFNERVQLVPSARMSSSALFDDYCEWTQTQGVDHISLRSFGKALTTIGVPSIASNGIKRIGVLLRRDVAA